MEESSENINENNLTRGRSNSYVLLRNQRRLNSLKFAFAASPKRMAPNPPSERKFERMMERTSSFDSSTMATTNGLTSINSVSNNERDLRRVGSISSVQTTQQLSELEDELQSTRDELEQIQLELHNKEIILELGVKSPLQIVNSGRCNLVRDISNSMQRKPTSRKLTLSPSTASLENGLLLEDEKAEFVRIRIIEAENLVPSHPNSVSPDCYVVCELNCAWKLDGFGERFESECIQNTENPVWNCEFDLEVRDYSSQRISFRVFDSVSNSLLGSASISPSVSDSVVDLWVHLQNGSCKDAWLHIASRRVRMGRNPEKVRQERDFGVDEKQIHSNQQEPSTVECVCVRGATGSKLIELMTIPSRNERQSLFLSLLVQHHHFLMNSRLFLNLLFDRFDEAVHSKSPHIVDGLAFLFQRWLVLSPSDFLQHTLTDSSGSLVLTELAREVDQFLINAEKTFNSTDSRFSKYKKSLQSIQSRNRLARPFITLSTSLLEVVGMEDASDLMKTNNNPILNSSKVDFFLSNSAQLIAEQITLIDFSFLASSLIHHWSLTEDAINNNINNNTHTINNTNPTTTTTTTTTTATTTTNTTSNIPNNSSLNNSNENGNNQTQNNSNSNVRHTITRPESPFPLSPISSSVNEFNIWSDRIFRLFLSEFCKAPESKKSMVIEKIVDIGIEMIKLNNFEGANRMWRILKFNGIRISMNKNQLEKSERLNILFDSSANFRNYKGELKRACQKYRSSNGVIPWMKEWSDSLKEEIRAQFNYAMPANMFDIDKFLFISRYFSNLKRYLKCSIESSINLNFVSPIWNGSYLPYSFKKISSFQHAISTSSIFTEKILKNLIGNDSMEFVVGMSDPSWSLLANQCVASIRLIPPSAPVFRNKYFGKTLVLVPRSTVLAFSSSNSSTTTANATTTTTTTFTTNTISSSINNIGNDSTSNPTAIQNSLVMANQSNGSFSSIKDTPIKRNHRPSNASNRNMIPPPSLEKIQNFVETEKDSLIGSYCFLSSHLRYKSDLESVGGIRVREMEVESVKKLMKVDRKQETQILTSILRELTYALLNCVKSGDSRVSFIPTKSAPEKTLKKHVSLKNSTVVSIFQASLKSMGSIYITKSHVAFLSCVSGKREFFSFKISNLKGFNLISNGLVTISFTTNSQIIQFNFPKKSDASKFIEQLDRVVHQQLQQSNGTTNKSSSQLALNGKKELNGKNENEKKENAKKENEIEYWNDLMVCGCLSLKESEWVDLSKDLERVHLKHGQLLNVFQKSGNIIYYLESGEVTFKFNHGVERISVQEGQFIGEFCLVTSAEKSSRDQIELVVSSENASLLSFPVSKFQIISPKLLNRFIRLLSITQLARLLQRL